MSATFQIQQEDRYYGFTFISENKQVLLHSRLYRSKALCEKAIEEVRAAVDSLEAFDKVSQRDGQQSFVLRDRKLMTLGYSPMFWSASTLEYAIQQLRREVPSARITYWPQGKILSGTI